MVVADPRALAAATAAPIPEPSSVPIGGDRGRLDIAQRAVERIAEITARRHGAVVRRDAVLGRGLPKACAAIAGRRTRVEVRVAAAWGRPLSEVATEVRQAVTTDIERFTALGVDRVDVEITSVETTQTSTNPAGSHQDGDLPAAARSPVAGPAAGAVGVVAAVVLIVLGAVGVAEMLRSVGLLRGEVIRPDWFGWTAVLEPTSWLRPAGVAAVVIGLVLLVIAVKPRRRTHLAVQGPDTIVWIGAADAARLAAESATGLDSVTAASVVARRRRLDATVTTFGDPARVRDEVRTSIAERLRTVSPQPRVRIELRED